MKKIKIYGERNTGTNYLSELINGNLQVEQLRGVVPDKKIWTRAEVNKNLYFALTAKNNLGWKHSYVDLVKILAHDDLNNICFVTVTKNPYSFLLSLFKRPYHYKGVKPKNFFEFIQTEWLLQKRDNIAAGFYKNPIELWNSKNSSYLLLKERLPRQTLNIKYEDLVEDPNLKIDEISEFFSLQKKAEFRNYLKSTKERSKSFSDYQNYYLNEEWKDSLNDDLLKLTNQYLDTAVMNSFGYKILQPTTPG